MGERQRLMNTIRMHQFAMVDLGLYLNSHPNCQKGLACFRKHKAMRDEAVAAYQSKFGPLTFYDGGACDRWNWVDGPWPWEMEA